MEKFLVGVNLILDPGLYRLGTALFILFRQEPQSASDKNDYADHYAGKHRDFSADITAGLFVLVFRLAIGTVFRIYLEFIRLLT